MWLWFEGSSVFELSSLSFLVFNFFFLYNCDPYLLSCGSLALD